MSACAILAPGANEVIPLGDMNEPQAFQVILDAAASGNVRIQITTGATADVGVVYDSLLRTPDDRTFSLQILDFWPEALGLTPGDYYLHAKSTSTTTWSAAVKITIAADLDIATWAACL